MPTYWLPTIISFLQTLSNVQKPKIMTILRSCQLTSGLSSMRPTISKTSLPNISLPPEPPRPDAGLARLAVEKQSPSQGKLTALKEKIQLFFRKTPPRDVSQIISRLAIDLPALRHNLNDKIHQAFDSFAQFIGNIKLPFRTRRTNVNSARKQTPDP